MTDVQLVITTLPNADAAAELAHRLVEEGLAACCNLFPAVRSIYRWKERVEDGSEVLVLIKTRYEQLDRVQARILELHPYELPECLVLPVERGYAGYLEWIAQSTG
jgi:periplasmic divalent cation tolerance protein